MNIIEPSYAGIDRQFAVLDRRLGAREDLASAIGSQTDLTGNYMGLVAQRTENTKNRTANAHQAAVANLMGAIQFMKQYRMQEKQLNEQRAQRRQTLGLGIANTAVGGFNTAFGSGGAFSATGAFATDTALRNATNLATAGSQQYMMNRNQIYRGNMPKVDAGGSSPFGVGNYSVYQAAPDIDWMGQYQDFRLHQ